MSQPYAEANHPSRPSTPRWVKVFGIIALVVALLFVFALVAGGEHGPGRHMPPAHAGGNTTLAGGSEEETPAVSAPAGHTSPIGHGG